MCAVQPQIDAHTTTFSYEQMDAMDQGLFLLAYLENHRLDTPAKVILNETIELAKRYGTTNSSKLVNGILPRVLGLAKNLQK
jgi:N utilization substance protein B